MHILRLMITAVAVCLLIVAASTAAADVVVPDEWTGVWDVDMRIVDCESGFVYFETTRLDTVCPGTVFEEPEPGEYNLECTGSADGDSYTMHCEGSREPEPGCIEAVVFDMTGTLDGDSYTTIGTTTVTYTGDCTDPFDSCQRTETTGTRIDGPPNPCDGTPVESLSWTAVKSFYR